MLKILQLTKKFPSPLIDGEVLAIYYLGRSLADRGCQVSLLSMNTTRHMTTAIQKEDVAHYHHVESVKVDNRIKVVDAFLNLFTSRSYHIERFISTDYQQALIQLLSKNKYDIIQLETLYLAPYVNTIRQYSNAKIVLRSHNIEHEIWKRITENTTRIAKRFYLNLLTNRLKKFELSTLNDFDMVVPVTERDRSFFSRYGLKSPAFVAPIGLDFKNYIPNQTDLPAVNQRNSDVIHFCFIGSLDWMPNIEGLDWLLDEVWPSISKKYPSARFHVAGRNAPERILSLNINGLIVHGEVDDAKQFINQCDVMLVPLFSGSGMRVKILEGMALGKVIISTRIGLEGIHATNEQEILLADNTEDFMKQISYCVENPEELSKMGDKARSFIHYHFDTHLIAERLIQAYQKLMA